MGKRIARAWKRRKNWAPGDLDFPTKLRLQKLERGKTAAGAWVYLTQEHMAAAIGSGRVDPATLVARRSVLDPGTGQILIRLKKE